MVDRYRNSPTTGPLQRAAVACKNCRVRKIKCDAQSSASKGGCTPCRRAGQECLLNPLSDGRKSVSIKLVNKLQQRIESLEALNQHAMGRLPVDLRANEDQNSSLGDICVQIGDQSTIQSDGTTTLETDPPDPSPSRVPDDSRQNPSGSTTVPVRSPHQADGDCTSFYGATCHPHVVSPGRESYSSSPNDNNIGPIELDADAPRLRYHLFRSFFRYQRLWVDIVDKEMFLLHQAENGDSRWFSKFLENAMLACSTRLSTSKSVRALGPKFCERAKDEVLRAMSDPSPANLQGFLLLSEYEVSHGNDRPGWMFCGAACRMLSDLGLHELAGVLRSPGLPQEPTKESSLAYALLSACIVYEGVWALYLGRPSSIPPSMMNKAALRYQQGQKSDSRWLNAWLGLSIPMAQVTQVLNEHNMSGSERNDALLKLSKEIETWHKDLPPELGCNDDSLTNMDPAGYGLQIQYYKVQILLRQALAKSSNARKRRYSQITNDTVSASLNDSSLLTYEYAIKIARLVTTYREAFGVEKVPSIMLDSAVVAATSMIHHLNKVDNVNDPQNRTTWLHQLVKSMELVQPHFPIVGRMLESLKQIGGSGSISDLFVCAPQSSTDIATCDPPRIAATDFNTQTYIASPHTANHTNPEKIWDFSDADFASQAFLPVGFGDAFFNLSTSEAMLSNLADQ